MRFTGIGLWQLDACLWPKALRRTAINGLRRAGGLQNSLDNTALDCCIDLLNPQPEPDIRQTGIYALARLEIHVGEYRVQERMSLVSKHPRLHDHHAAGIGAQHPRRVAFHLPGHCDE